MSRDESATRRRILKATCKLLAAGQGQGVRMVDIAKAAKISRQAVYLHFPNRAELLIAAVRYLDVMHDSDARLAASRNAKNGLVRLDAFIEAWANYIPEVYGVARALLAMKDTDAEAKAAWDDRMDALREGCAAAVDALERDRRLNPVHSREEATDILWMLISIRNWEHLTQDRGWSQEDYAQSIREIARRVLVRSG
jgi:AcrR family transcriptional regulator